MSQENYYNLSVEEVEKVLSTNIKSGLSSSEAQKRSAEYGTNEFNKIKHKSLLVKFLNQFKSFMIIVLLVAAAISGVIGNMHGEGFTDAILIIGIVVLNAVMGVFQESKAEKSLDALQKLSSPHCKVVRDGRVEVIDSLHLVPGDVVILETGDSVPADMRLVEAVNLQVQEAALTGESMPEGKFTDVIPGEVSLGDRDNMAYSSCSVTYGRGKGIVTAIGMSTEVGKIASMIQSVKETKTPLQEKLDKLGKVLAIAAMAICGLIFVVGLLYGRDALDMFMTAVSLAVAAIPEALPAVSTMVLALGVMRLVKKNAIIRKLPSVETLGSTQVICSDKTGTLTQNRMTVVKLYLEGRQLSVSDIGAEFKEQADKLIELSLLANDARMERTDGKWETIGDPTETAMIDLGIKRDVIKDSLDAAFPRVAEIPFDSDRKMMTTVHKDASGKLSLAVKGGVDEILLCCDRIFLDGQVRKITEKEAEELRMANLDMAGNALRVLAVAMKDIDKLPENIEPSTLEKELVFVGMMGMIDPPREEVKVAVQKCRHAGIKPVMITGDHKITAVAIARELGIMDGEGRAVTGLELENMSDSQLKSEVDSISVYARVSPEHKVRIVQAFKDNGEIVAMTGDGVNDAPALKLADIGIAMGITGTDVSKEAADVVLTDDNFATIVSAVEEGRRIYDNILNAIQFMLSTNFGEIIVLFVAVMLNWAAPLLPIHILWINLVTDSLPALALSVDPAAPDVMSRPPVDSRKGIMNRAFSTRIVLLGLMVGALSLIAYRIGLQESIESARTMTFAVLGFTQITLVFCVRSGSRSAFKTMFNNMYLIGSAVIVTALMLIVLEIPSMHSIFRVTALNNTQWTWVVALSLTPFVVTELVKAGIRIFKKHN